VTDDEALGDNRPVEEMVVEKEKRVIDESQKTVLI